MEARKYTTRRQSLVAAMVSLLKKINGAGDYNSDIDNQVFGKLNFWDEIAEFPSIYVTAGSEIRRYQGGGYKDRYITLVIRLYVKSEDTLEELDKFIEDIETVIEENSNFAYYDKRGVEQRVHQCTIIGIDTDEGLLAPIGVGEILVEVQY